ncbi:MAG: hypothetical protein WDN49_10120 [Acetobacteraceae bacterium]
MNVHQYNGTQPGALHRRVAALGKPLWASEVGCCFSGNRTEMGGALFMAATIQSALRDLGADGLVFLADELGRDRHLGTAIRAPGNSSTPSRNTPASSVPDSPCLSSQGDSVLAALSPDRRQLVLVAINGSDGAARADFRPDRVPPPRRDGRGLSDDGGPGDQPCAGGGPA